MMGVYLISGQYTFDEENKELKKTKTQQTIKLTSMRARCLAYIIEHADEKVIEKSALSEALWGPRSKFTSDASLTQVLYLIRRDMKALGIEELFVTIPKSGIQVNTTVTIEMIPRKLRRKKIPWIPVIASLALSSIATAVAVFFVTH